MKLQKNHSRMEIVHCTLICHYTQNPEIVITSSYLNQMPSNYVNWSLDQFPKQTIHPGSSVRVKCSNYKILTEYKPVLLLVHLYA